MAESAEIKKMSANHDAILDYLMMNPTAKKGDIAIAFGVSRAWLSIIVNSDAFKNAKDIRNDQFFGATVVPIREKMVGVVDLALDRLLEQAELMDTGMALETADTILHRLGYAPNTKQAGQSDGSVNIQQNNYLVNAGTLAAAQSRFGKPVTGEVIENDRTGISDSTSEGGVEFYQGSVPAEHERGGQSSNGTGMGVLVESAQAIIRSRGLEGDGAVQREGEDS